MGSQLQQICPFLNKTSFHQKKHLFLQKMVLYHPEDSTKTHRFQFAVLKKQRVNHRDDPKAMPKTLDEKRKKHSAKHVGDLQAVIEAQHAIGKLLILGKKEVRQQDVKACVAPYTLIFVCFCF